MNSQASPYIPSYCTTTSTPSDRIAIIGAPGSGKTTSAATFPNRIWFDFDHNCPKGEHAFPFWDADFVDLQLKIPRLHKLAPPNRRDAFKKVLREEHPKFTAEQTLILDSWTIMQNAFDQQTQLEEAQAAKPNPFAFWRRKIDFSIEIMEMLKACKCRVVVIFHETIDRDDDGLPNGKIKPVMDGSFKDQLLGHFQDVWRQVRDPIELMPNGLRKIENGRPVVTPGFFWVLNNDPQVDTKMNSLLGEKARTLGKGKIKASYEELQTILNGK